MGEEDFIIDILDFLKEKIKNKTCTKEQVDAVHRTLSESLDIFATAEELSKHYGKSLDAVHGIIKRNMIQKPKRNVTLYSFKAFQKIIPSSWRKSK